MSPKVLGERTACALATRVIEQILDVLIGRRSLHQIRDRISGPVAGLLSNRLGKRSAESPDYRLRSVHACLTSSSKVEACAVLGTQGRVRALVLRLEQENTQWCCTLLSLL